MRWTLLLAVLMAGAPLRAEEIAIDSAVYLERTDLDGARRIEPARLLSPGDRVVTVLRWDAPRGGYTATSAVPSGLAIESLSRTGLEVSTDGGRSWRRIEAPSRVPAGATHLRWQLSGGEGRMSYRAVVMR